MLVCKVICCNPKISFYHCRVFLVEISQHVLVPFVLQEAQLNEVLSASNLDPTALTVVTRKLEVRSVTESLLAFSEGRCVLFTWNGQIVSACLFL